MEKCQSGCQCRGGICSRPKGRWTNNSNTLTLWNVMEKCQSGRMYLLAKEAGC